MTPLTMALLQAGVVRLVLRQQRHRHFERQGDDLAAEVQISLLEALSGFRRPLRHLDGQLWMASDREVTRPGQRKVLRGFGMPRFRGRGKGDLVVHFSVLFPRAAYTGDQARLLRNLLPRDVSAGSPKAGTQARTCTSASACPSCACACATYAWACICICTPGAPSRGVARGGMRLGRERLLTSSQPILSYRSHSTYLATDHTPHSEPPRD